VVHPLTQAVTQLSVRKVITLYISLTAYETLVDKDKRQRYDMFGEDGAEQHNPFDHDSFFNSQGTGHFHFNFDDLFKEFGGDNDDDFFGGGFQGHSMFDDMFGSHDDTFGGMFEQHTTSSRGNHGNWLTLNHNTLSHRSTL